MKRIYTFLGAILIATIIFAQAPSKMSFQAVVRDSNNNLVTNTSVGLRISILQNTAVVYIETQTPVTNANGLFSIEIGGGAGFELIDWTNGPYFIRSEVDPTGGTNYSITGMSQLLSVPYALHALTAGSLTGSNALKLKGADTGVGSNAWSQFGNSKTDPLKDKLGTIDPADMVFVTNNQERIRIKSDGPTDVSNDLTVKKSVYLNTVDGGTTNSGTLTVGGITNLNNALNVNNQSPTYLSGDLDVDGTTTFQGEASFVGETTMSGANFTGQVTIDATLSGEQDNYNGYPLRVQGSGQGIAVKINGSRTNANNYVTFWDENGVQGRIEGETIPEMLLNPETIVQNSLYAADIVLGGLDVGIAGWEFGQAIADLAAACSSSTGCAGFGVVVCAPIPSLIVAAVANLVLKTATLAIEIGNEVKSVAEAAAYNTFKVTQIGVTYQSGAGDYAEYLPKANTGDDFNPGDVVGVKFGSISANTDDAEKVMVVSTKAVVLGNAPAEGEEPNYEKIAFMGQVPVNVLGPVAPGDYILPSGQNDRYGKAKKPDELTILDYSKIIGIAWQGSDGPGAVINVAVGLNANDVALYTQKLEERIDAQALEIEDLVKRLLVVEDKLANGNSGNPNAERKIKYYKPKRDQLEEGLEMAEAKLRDDGVDVDNHPFFKKMKEDPAYKEEFFSKVDAKFDKEVEEKTIYNNKHGIKTEKE